MASTIPAGMKTADIARFAIRAAQLERMDPVMNYWCNYWIINQILAKNLHNSNDENMAYTVRIMDQLEKVKVEHSVNDAIVDDVAGKAYVEQFGLDTLVRAENAMKQNRVTRQTADTLHAAATFLELCQIWGILEPELASKIKFAKYHAVRIAKAIKAGEDPNLSNPVVEPLSTEEESYIPSDISETPGVQGIPNAGILTRASRQPTVEEVPDGHDQFEPYIAPGSLRNQPLHASRDDSQSRSQNRDAHSGREGIPPNNTEDYYTQLPPTDEILPPWNTQNQSDGGEYFPKVAQPGNDNAVSLPEMPSGEPNYLAPTSQPLTPAETGTSPRNSSSFYPQNLNRPQPRSLESFPPPQMDEPPTAEQPQAPESTYVPQQFIAPRYPSARPSQPLLPPAQLKSQDHVASSIPATAQPQVSNQTNFVADEEAIMTAQKHARWAISALNFEDVKTAVKELKGALDALGGR